MFSTIKAYRSKASPDSLLLVYFAVDSQWVKLIYFVHGYSEKRICFAIIVNNPSTVGSLSLSLSMTEPYCIF